LSTLSDSEIGALITLLEDDDVNIYEHVLGKILSLGEDALPHLEDRFYKETNTALQSKITEVMEIISMVSVESGLLSWAKAGGVDLFEGIYQICKIKYPQLDKQYLSNQLNKIKLDIWLDLNYAQSPIDKVNIINKYLYEQYGLKGNTNDYFQPNNSFINIVLESKQGNPISLAIIYSLVAQRLNLPIFGVNLPQHFILAYKNDKDFETNKVNQTYLDYHEGGEVLFYINAFNKGTIFTRANIDQFLKQLQIKPIDFYFEPCSNIDIVIRVLRNLINAYEKNEDQHNIDKLSPILSMMEPFGTIV
jgi:regulator of sirC expression with transglutaminase-like and TPR domain